MKTSIRGTQKKKRGRPPTTGRGLQIGMRWHNHDLKAIDAYAKSKQIERTDAIRRLVRMALSGATKK